MCERLLWPTATHLHVDLYNLFVLRNVISVCNCISSFCFLFIIEPWKSCAHISYVEFLCCIFVLFKFPWYTNLCTLRLIVRYIFVIISVYFSFFTWVYHGFQDQMSYIHLHKKTKILTCLYFTYNLYLWIASAYILWVYGNASLLLFFSLWIRKGKI